MSDCPTCGHPLSEDITFQIDHRDDGYWEVTCRQGDRIGWALRKSMEEAQEKAVLRMREKR